MKYLLLLSVLLVGCDQIYNEICDDYYYDNINKSEIFYSEEFFEPMNNIEIASLINRNVSYNADDVDYWQTAESTWIKGHGDCEDIAILYINIVYASRGEKYDIVLVDSDDIEAPLIGPIRKIESGGKIDHALVRSPDGICIDPRSGFPVKCDVGYSYSFNSLFRI